MKITAITRYKSGTLYMLLKRLNWSQTDLAKKTKMSQVQIGHIINLKKRPTAKQAQDIQFAFGEAGEYVDILSEWPETFQGLTHNGFEQTAEVDVGNLLENPEILQIEAPLSEHEDDKLSAALEDAMATLSDRERTLLRELFLEGKTMSELALRYRVDRQTLQQVKDRALRKLRHPTRFVKLIDFAKDHEEDVSRELKWMEDVDNILKVKSKNRVNEEKKDDPVTDDDTPKTPKTPKTPEVEVAEFTQESHAYVVCVDEILHCRADKEWTTWDAYECVFGKRMPGTFPFPSFASAVVNAAAYAKTLGLTTIQIRKEGKVVKTIDVTSKTALAELLALPR